MNSKMVLFTILLHLVTIIIAQDPTIVQLEKGKIRGTILKSENGMDYYAFQEIPYAAPPVGPNRYQLPREPEPWANILDATKNTKICMQGNADHYPQQKTEDCLYLNVYTPVAPGTNNNLPVLFWIHGGSYIVGSGIFTDFGPKYFIDHGVIVVTINYRLGAFGFVGTDDGTIPLNLGLKDQRLAMEWVNKNIHLFGGNPNQVIISGESAGSISVSYHIISQRPDENVFHGAIMQSGSAIDSGLKQSYPSGLAFSLGKRLNPNFNSNSTSELLKVLQSANANAILASGIGGSIAVEKQGLFSYPGYQAYMDKRYKKIPVIIGFNSEESLTFGVLPKNENMLRQIDNDPSVLISPRVNIAPQNRHTVGLLYKQLYTHNTSFVNDFGGYVRCRSDSIFITGISKQVELSCEDAPYYFYQFSYKGELGGQMGYLNQIPAGAERVGHGEDCHYMWEDYSNRDLNRLPQADQLTLHRFTKMWTNFVKYFNPTPEPDPLLGNIIWRKSDRNNLGYLNINATLEMREHPRQYQQLKAILEQYMLPPFDSFE